MKNRSYTLRRKALVEPHPTRRIPFFAVLLASCAAPYAAPPLPASHPASPAATIAPAPLPSRAFTGDLLPPPASAGGHEHHEMHGPESRGTSHDEQRPTSVTGGGREHVHHGRREENR